MKESINNKAKEILSNAIADMYYNNANGNHESFKNWCEIGDIFENNTALSEEERVACINLMEEIAPLVDSVTNCLIWEHTIPNTNNDKEIEKGNENVAELIKIIAHCRSVAEVWLLLQMQREVACFKIDDKIQVCFRNVIVTILEDKENKLKLLKTIKVVTEDGETIYVGDMELLGADYVEKEDKSYIYIQKPKTNQPKYDGELLNHLLSIWEEPSTPTTLSVELSGEKYIIRGLFANEDTIIDVFLANDMKHIDRYFVVGSQDGADNETNHYYEYFLENVVKDRHINECWYLSEEEFQFLKNNI